MTVLQRLIYTLLRYIIHNILYGSRLIDKYHIT